MKKNLLSGIITFTVILLSLTGCGKDLSVSSAGINGAEIPEVEDTDIKAGPKEDAPEDKETEEDIKEEEEEKDVSNDNKEADISVYDSILEYYYTVLSDDQAELSDDYSYAWVMDAKAIGSVNERLDRIGFCYLDITNDGIKELIIGEFPYEYEYYYTIDDIYSIRDGSPVLIDEGWSRSRLFLLDDGLFYTEGSSSAFDFSFGSYELKENGERNWEDFYRVDTNADLKFYHSTTGDYMPEDEKEISATQEDIDTIIDSYRKRIVPIDLSSFSSLSDKYGEPVSCAFYVYEDDGFGKLETLYTLDDNPYTVGVRFAPKESVSDFTYLKLSFKDVDNEGNVSYDISPLTVLGDIDRFDKAFIMQATFGDVFAEYGFSYVDEKGKKHTFALYASGEDGSIYYDELD